MAVGDTGFAPLGAGSPGVRSTLGPEGGEVGPTQSGWKLALRELAGNRTALVGFGLLLFFVLFSFVGPLIYHTNQSASSLALSNLGPSGAHLFGTNEQGFDELGQLMVGGQTALEVGFFAAFVATVIGTLYGAVAGLAGGIVDAVMMRFVDTLYSIPFLFVALILAAKFGSTVLGLSLVIGGYSWLVPSRLVRGEVLSLRTRDFVAAARVAGARRSRLIGRHLIPNALSVVVVNTSFQVADAILAVAYIGFLGFGLHYPTFDWGDMLANAVQYQADGYWWLIYPVGACLVLTVMAVNFIGDGLRDALDPRLRRR